jgi:hypothetical protein
MSVPPDLTLRYFWVAPTVRPPYHHEFTITIGPGLQGQVSYIPNYPNHNPPRWLEPFSIAAADLEALYAQLLKKDVFHHAWKLRPPGFVGGEQAWIEASAGEQRASIPAGLAPRDAALVQPLFDAVRALVPQAIWDKLEGQRQEYIKSQLK